MIKKIKIDIFIKCLLFLAIAIGLTIVFVFGFKTDFLAGANGFYIDFKNVIDTTFFANAPTNYSNIISGFFATLVIVIILMLVFYFALMLLKVTYDLIRKGFVRR